VQQRHCIDPAAVNSYTPADLRHRPPVTVLPPDGKEKVYRAVRWCRFTGGHQRLTRPAATSQRGVERNVGMGTDDRKGMS
jgi:hypothetical protein